MTFPNNFFFMAEIMFGLFILKKKKIIKLLSVYKIVAGMTNRVRTINII